MPAGPVHRRCPTHHVSSPHFLYKFCSQAASLFLLFNTTQHQHRTKQRQKHLALYILAVVLASELICELVIRLINSAYGV